VKIEVECIYEKGALKPLKKLDLSEGEKVRVIIEKNALSREQYLKAIGIKEKDIVEYDVNEELETFKKLKDKSKRRCQY